ncbi:MAG: DUF362 domain-containing protein [Nitrososphaerales archaeon]
MSKVVIIKGEDPHIMIEKALKYFTKPFNKRIILKPNLINTEPPPTTTPCETIEALVEYYLKFGFELVIAEGSGWCNTHEAYRKLGYLKLKEKYGVKLVDINNDDFGIVKNPNALFLKEFEFPLTLKDAYIISVPVLKEHSITKVTLSLKNMLGATIGEKARVAKKGRFHKMLNESIIDINLYLKPRLAIIDGRVAGLGGELKAKPKKLNVMIFSEDLVAADSVGASYFGKAPLEISHLKLAQKVGLGIADLNKIEVINIK